MDKITNIYIYLIGLVALASCSDDFDAPNRGQESDGNLCINFSVSQLNSIATRASDEVKSVHLYAFDASRCLQHEVLVLDNAISQEGGSSDALYFPNDDVKKNKDNVTFYFVANATDLPDEKGVSTFLGLNKDVDYIDVDGKFTVSSKGYTYSEIKSSETNAIPLYHNAVKITVSEAERVSQDYPVYGNGNTKYSFLTAWSAAKSPLFSGGISSVLENAVYGTPTAVVDNDLNSKTLTQEDYIHPTKNTGDNANKTFVVVKAVYREQDYYYRLDFQKKRKDGKSTEPFDVTANHWYQFLIKSVSGPGYATPAEAAKNPTPMVDYVIHDHAPVIYNMISDGSRELGVSHEVVRNTSDPGIQKDLYIKLFSPNADEMAEITMSNWKQYIHIDAPWLTVAAIEETTDPAHIGSDGFGDDNTSGADKNDTGRVWKVSLNFLDKPGTYETDIEVEWHGLSRKVPVIWNRKFDPSLLFSPEVSVKFFNSPCESWNNSCEMYDAKYFTSFIDTKSHGTSAEANCGSSRSSGLHFPMPYGDGSMWSYMYEVSLNSNLSSGAFNWSVRSDGVSGLKFSKNGSSDWNDSGVSGGRSDAKFYVTRSAGSNDYKYETGSLIITIDGIDYPLEVYHTGFFHQDKERPTNDGSVDAVKGSVNGGWTYYEVIGSNGDYWLDRNIGAKSCDDYIEGVSAYGSVDARGYYMLAAKYHSYSDPDMFSGLVPPGYDIPTVEQWDLLRKSTAFHAELSGAYYVAYLQTNVDNGKKVYFPRSQYYEGEGNIRGESRAGYFWTKTPASGVEKVEIGNWLKAMTVAGKSTSYINARVIGKDSDPFFLSMRAVRQKTGSTSTKRLSFLVKGATHVYLYTEEEGADGKKIRNAVTTWPGQAIGNAETVANSTDFFNFSYENKINDAEKFFVIFNYVGSSGQIYTMSKDKFGVDVTHTNINPGEAHGWQVYGATTDQFNITDYTDCRVTINESTSRQDTKWTCNPETSVTGGDVESYRRYRFYWKSGYENDGGTKERDYIYILSLPIGAKTINGATIKNGNWYDRISYDSSIRSNYFDFMIKESDVSFTAKFIVASDKSFANQSANLCVDAGKFKFDPGSGYYVYKYESTDFGTKQTDIICP